MALNKHNQALRTWLEISQADLADNYRQLRSLLKPETRLLAVVKSNAYGHSLVDYARAVADLGADFIAVDSVLEAFKLRQAGLTLPLLVLGHTLLDNVEEAARQHISLTVSSPDSLAQLVAKPLPTLKVHLKFDTGMCRQGFFSSQAEAVLDALQSAPWLQLEGVYTHFAGAKDPADQSSAQRQLSDFEQVLAALKPRGLKPLRHAAASAGAIALPAAHYDMVRFGIALMGLWPSEGLRQQFADRLSLRPILSWKTVAAELKWVPAGSAVGYDGTETVARDSRLAVLPVGYWHGYDRSLSSLAYVLAGGRRAKVLGRVSMDMIVADVTDIPELETGDEVVLIGAQGEQYVGAEELGVLAGTSAYEIVTRLNPQIQRFY